MQMCSEEDREKVLPYIPKQTSGADLGDSENNKYMFSFWISNKTSIRRNINKDNHEVENRYRVACKQLTSEAVTFWNRVIFFC